MPRVYMDHTCLPPDWDDVEQISAYVDGPSPISVKWTDGVTDPQRLIHYPAQAQTYSLASASDAYCSAVIDPAVYYAKVYGGALPDFITGVGTVCINTPHSVSLNTPPPPNATVFWSIDNGTILSGQGTSSAQYQAATEGSATLTCFFKFPEAYHCPALIGVSSVEPNVGKSRRSRGQATVEWVLLVSLVVVAIFALIFFFRHYIIELATEAWLKIQEWTE